jgi:hypothetical protein
MLKFKKYRVCRFAPRPVHVLDKFPRGERFFSPYGKNLSPCGNLSWTRTGRGAKRQTLYFLTIEMKLKF